MWRIQCGVCWWDRKIDKDKNISGIARLPLRFQNTSIIDHPQHSVELEDTEVLTTVQMVWKRSKRGHMYQSPKPKQRWREIQLATSIKKMKADRLRRRSGRGGGVNKLIMLWWFHGGDHQKVPIVIINQSPCYKWNPFPPPPPPPLFPCFQNKHGRPSSVQVPSPGLYHVWFQNVWIRPIDFPLFL